MTNTKALKKLKKYYKRLLSRNNKYCISNNLTCMEYLVNYLQYMRDYYLIASDIEKDNIKINMIMGAIQEYEAYISCISKYYTITSTEVTIKANLGDPDKVRAAYAEEKEAHWNTFWWLVAQNMESWSN